MKPKFTPEINLGHILQATVVAVTLGGGAITSYISLRSDIQQVRSDLAVKIGEHDMRISSLEASIKEIKDDNKDFHRDITSAIQKMYDLLSDVRVQIGKAK